LFCLLNKNFWALSKQGESRGSPLATRAEKKNRGRINMQMREMIWIEIEEKKMCDAADFFQAHTQNTHTHTTERKW
jgi:hypothetical protein